MTIRSPNYFAFHTHNIWSDLEPRNASLGSVLNVQLSLMTLSKNDGRRKTEDKYLRQLRRCVCTVPPFGVSRNSALSWCHTDVRLAGFSGISQRW